MSQKLWACLWVVIVASHTLQTMFTGIIYVVVTDPRLAGLNDIVHVVVITLDGLVWVASLLWMILLDGCYYLQ